MKLQSVCRKHRFDRWFEKTFPYDDTSRYSGANKVFRDKYLRQLDQKTAWMRDRMESTGSAEFADFKYWNRYAHGKRGSNGSDDEEEDYEFSDEDEEDDTSGLEAVLREITTPPANM